MNHLDPARTIIGTLGGPEKVAQITGRHVSRVYRWMYPIERGGTGGVIPHGEARKMLAHAVAEGLPIAPSDFFQIPSTPSL
jgi:hypothetical protein